MLTKFHRFFSHFYHSFCRFVSYDCLMNLCQSLTEQNIAFLRTGSTQSTGFAAIKLTALGRPQFLVCTWHGIFLAGHVLAPYGAPWPTDHVLGYLPPPPREIRFHLILLAGFQVPCNFPAFSLTAWTVIPGPSLHLTILP